MIDTLPLRGTYTLIIFLSKESCIEIGQQGTKRFPKGYYSYTGSALGTGSSSLKQRLSRHLRKAGKKKHWHIDFLLAHEEATVTAVVAAQTERKMECELNEHIEKQGFAEIPISGFGSSDCKGNACMMHASTMRLESKV
jgi:Uri superfamily endonuclease